VLTETPDYKNGFELGKREASIRCYDPHKPMNPAWKRGYDAGWKSGCKNSEYDEIVLINAEGDSAPWKKRRAVMESEQFQTWIQERRNTHPFPADPYRAFMIDKSLKADLRTKPGWAPETNRSDFKPVDYPPITKEPAPDIEEPSPKTVQAEETKKLLRARAKFIADDMNVPVPEIRFTTAQKGRARSFYRSGYGQNRATGAVVKITTPAIVLGISKKGHLLPTNYGTLAHEMGHHKTVIELERAKGEKAVGVHYRALVKSHKATEHNERIAWKNADPYMKDQRPLQKWHKKWALGTYLGTTPGYR